MRAPSIPLNKQAKAQGFNARFVLLESQPLKDGRCAICLQVSHLRKVRRYSLGEACAKEQWDTDTSRVRPRVKGAAQSNGVLNALEARVVGIVDALVVHGSLSLTSFNARYRNPKATEDVVELLLEMHARMLAEGRVGYAATFKDTAAALRRFAAGGSLRLVELTAQKLEGFDRFLRREGCTGGGIGVYMRSLRVVVNSAIKDGLMHRDNYPFEAVRGSGYSMKKLNSSASPRALDADALQRLRSFPFDEHPALTCCVKYFLFSLHARGINFADMARLRHTNLVDGRLEYTRLKVRRKGERANFSLPLTAPMVEILKHFHDPTSSYLFPILKGTEQSEEAIWNRAKDRLKHVNTNLKEVSQVLGLSIPLTFYVARHSYATLLKRSGLDVSMISESMGHESVSTTKAYLKRFQDHELDRAIDGAMNRQLQQP